MVLRQFLKRILLVAALMIGSATRQSAQTTVTSPPAKSLSPVATAPPVLSKPLQQNTRVVAIVHRLSGLKLFRLLLRSDEDLQAVTRIDDSFTLKDQVHTNVVAGLALDDGETIVAWLPEAEVEFGSDAPFLPTPQDFTQRATGAMGAARAEAEPRSDLTVIGADGERRNARFVGLDGLTGLSVLRLTNKPVPVSRGTADESIEVGTNVRIVGPELAEQSRMTADRNLLVRMGETEGTVMGVTRAPSGDITRFKLHAPKLKVAYVGGVALNNAGEAVGIVSRIDGVDANVLPATSIRQAARRVLTNQASVPRPFLGVQGEAIAAISPTQLEGLGWQLDKAASLAGERRGILLTSIVPHSPAAIADLKAGDVILKVNGQIVKSGDDFSWLLDEAGPSTSVDFSVLRPQSLNEEAVKIKLSASLETRFAYNFSPAPLRRLSKPSLLDYGVETIALRAPVAARLGAAAGLLVVYVDSNVAPAHGLLPGDVIQTLDGQPLDLSHLPLTLPRGSVKQHKLEVIRKREKVTVTLPEVQ